MWQFFLSNSVAIPVKEIGDMLIEIELSKDLKMRVLSTERY